MSETQAFLDETQQSRERQSTDIRTVARTFGLLNLLAGAVGFIGPTIANDSDEFANIDPGMFLGVIAVNGRHALVHVLFGTLGLIAGRDSSSARGYMGLGAAVFGVMGAMGVRSFGFERGIHMVMGMAVDGWGNLAHAMLAKFCLITALRPQSLSDEQ